MGSPQQELNELFGELQGLWTSGAFGETGASDYPTRTTHSSTSGNIAQRLVMSPDKLRVCAVAPFQVPEGGRRRLKASHLHWSRLGAEDNATWSLEWASTGHRSSIMRATDLSRGARSPCKTWLDTGIWIYLIMIVSLGGLVPPVHCQMPWSGLDTDAVMKDIGTPPGGWDLYWVTKNPRVNPETATWPPGEEPTTMAIPSIFLQQPASQTDPPTIEVATVHPQGYHREPHFHFTADAGGEGTGSCRVHKECNWAMLYGAMDEIVTFSTYEFLKPHPVLDQGSNDYEDELLRLSKARAGLLEKWSKALATCPHNPIPMRLTPARIPRPGTRLMRPTRYNYDLPKNQRQNSQ